MGRCRICDRARNKAYWEEHREESRAASREWRARQPNKPPGVKPCARCGGEIPARRRYCDGCRDIVRAESPHRSGRSAHYHSQTPAERGYGTEHTKLRARWKRVVDSGAAVCARCGLRIEPGSPWDLGHVDGSAKMQYAGPEHRRCNRSTTKRRVKSFPW